MCPLFHTFPMYVHGWYLHWSHTLGKKGISRRSQWYHGRAAPNSKSEKRVSRANHGRQGMPRTYLGQVRSASFGLVGRSAWPPVFGRPPGPLSSKQCTRATPFSMRGLPLPWWRLVPPARWRWRSPPPAAAPSPPTGSPRHPAAVVVDKVYC
jgi:hypothetical protein